MRGYDKEGLFRTPHRFNPTARDLTELCPLCCQTAVFCWCQERNPSSTEIILANSEREPRYRDGRGVVFGVMCSLAMWLGIGLVILWAVRHGH